MFYSFLKIKPRQLF